MIAANSEITYAKVTRTHTQSIPRITPRSRLSIIVIIIASLCIYTVSIVDQIYVRVRVPIQSSKRRRASDQIDQHPTFRPPSLLMNIQDV